jgi:hypothetical protein
MGVKLLPMIIAETKILYNKEKNDTVYIKILINV